jgi:hypothetical protein
MGVNVYGPTKTCYIKKDGGYEIYDEKRCLFVFKCKNQGEFKKFSPDNRLKSYW